MFCDFLSYDDFFHWIIMVVSILFCQSHVIKGILTYEGRISKVYKRALTSVASYGTKRLIVSVKKTKF